MFMSAYYRFISLIVLLGLSTYLPAESFDLFNQDRGKPPVPAPTPKAEVKLAPLPKIKKPKTKPKVKLKPQQDFTLRGISYLSKKYRVILQLPDGKQRSIKWQSKQKRPIPGFSSYKLSHVNIKDSTVHIIYPEIAPCRKDNEAKGIKCDSKTLASLRFIYGKPSAVPRRIAKIQTGKQRSNNAKNNSNNLAKSFEKKLIGNNDIPDGMRRVRTPFGDRLVPKTP